jgi:LacI family transcriptional regulator
VVSGAISDTDDNLLLAGLPEVYILRGIQAVPDEKGLTILLTATGGRADAALQLLRRLAQPRVDGAIYVAPYHQQVALPKPTGAADAPAGNLPVLAFNPVLQRAIIASIASPGVKS